MNNTLPFPPASPPDGEPQPVRHPDQVLAELLKLNEEMVVQLRLERLSVVGTANFLTTMIEQHEKTAEMLRAQLENHNPDDAQTAGLFPRRLHREATDAPRAISVQ